MSNVSGHQVRRVLIISQLPPPVHGSSVMTVLLGRVLAEQGYEVNLVSRDFSKSVADVGKFAPRKVFRALSVLLSVARATTGSPPPVCIFFSTNRAFSFVVDVLLVSVLRLRKIHVVNYVHTAGWSELSSRGRFQRALVRRVLNRESRIVVLSESLIADIVGAVGSSSCISVIRNAVEPTVTHTPKLHGVRVVYLSNLIPEKGASDFVRVALHVHKVMPNVQFVMAGSGSDAAVRELLEEIGRLGLSRVVKYVGALNSHQKWELLSNASMLIFPSRYAFEAQPLVVLEAMSVGVPVCGYRVGSLTDVLGEGEGGFLAVPGDVGALASWAIDVLENPDDLARLGLAVQDRFSRLYSVEVFREAWRDVLNAEFRANT